MSQAVSPLEIKSASLDLLAILLRSSSIDVLEGELDSRFGQRFVHAPEAFVLDLEAIVAPQTLDLAAIVARCATRGIRILALRHPDAAVATLASAHGLAYCGEPSTRSSAAVQDKPQPVAETEPVLQHSMVIDKPVRAGQQIYAKGGDLIVLAMVSAGAEVIADGNIHVYAPLRGRALAGARGNTSARIFARAMEAELVSIAGVYRTIEQALPVAIQGKPAQIYLENERLVISALGD